MKHRWRLRRRVPQYNRYECEICTAMKIKLTGGPTLYPPDWEASSLSLILNDRKEPPCLSPLQLLTVQIQEQLK